MKTVIIVSKCLSVIKSKNGEVWYGFHFRGAYAGVLLKKVRLRGRGEEIVKGGEYIIHVKLISCENDTLIGDIIRSKSLDDCWDKT